VSNIINKNDTLSGTFPLWSIIPPLDFLELYDPFHGGGAVLINLR
jgi:hypothetical protein